MARLLPSIYDQMAFVRYEALGILIIFVGKFDCKISSNSIQAHNSPTAQSPHVAKGSGIPGVSLTP